MDDVDGDEGNDTDEEMAVEDVVESVIPEAVIDVANIRRGESSQRDVSISAAATYVLQSTRNSYSHPLRAYRRNSAPHQNSLPYGSRR